MRNSLILAVLLLTGPALSAVSLHESFEAARRNMESIKRADAQLRQSEELKIRARAAVLPTVSAVGSYTRIDPPAANGPSPFLLTRQYVAAMRVTQPLYRGGTISAYEAAQESILLSRYQKDATELNLAQLVINSYFNLAAAQADVINVEELLGFSRERLKVIKDRVKIGRSRRGELAEAEAQLSIAESQLRQARIQLREAEANYEFLTRMKPEKVALEDVPQISGQIQEYVGKVKARPDVLAAKQEAQVAERQIGIAKGGHHPQVDLTGNYYLSRTGVLATSKWDVGVAVSLPLFQGGGVSAQVREAVEGKRLAELRGMETERAAERDVAIAFQNIREIQEQLKSLKLALAKAEEAYLFNRRDYENGLVTNLEVLQALNVYMETKRSYQSLIAMAGLNFKSLEALTGVLP